MASTRTAGVEGSMRANGSVLLHRTVPGDVNHRKVWITTLLSSCDLDPDALTVHCQTSFGITHRYR